MKLFHFFAVFALCTSGSYAQSGDDSAFFEKYGSTFETPSAIPAKSFVPASALSGSLHSVRPLTYNDGLRNTYFVDTGTGVMEVTGTPLLLQRIRELYAIDYLRGVSRAGEFGKAIASAGRAKLESVGSLLNDPIGAVKNVPRGASRFFGRIGEGSKGGKGTTEDNGLKDLLGVTKAKVQLAAKLGVDPYSTNQELQQELTGVARAMAGGGLAVDLGSSVATGGAGVALTVIGANQTLQDVLTNSTPEDLRILNRKKLFALGVDRPLADEFLMHPWFSPWHETIITDALSRIGVDPTAYLTSAVRALTAEDAFFFQRTAQLLLAYHANAAPLRAIRLNGGIITALDNNGILVAPVSLDYAIWNESTARRAEEFMAIDHDSELIKGLALWTDGQLSDQLCEELKKRRIVWRMNALGAAGN